MGESLTERAQKADESQLKPANHKPDCKCAVCKNIALRIANGKAPYWQREHDRKLAVHKRRKARKRAKNQVEFERSVNLSGRKSSYEDFHNTNSFVDKPESVSVPSEKPEGVSENSEDTLTVTSLSALGGNAPVLAKSIIEGLEATKEYVIRDRQTGNVVDVIEHPDYITRAKYIEMALKLRGELKPNEEQANFQGGLVIVLPTNDLVTPGHKQGCKCDQCEARWNEMAPKLLAAHRKETEAVEARIELEDAEFDPEDNSGGEDRNSKPDGHD